MHENTQTSQAMDLSFEGLNKMRFYKATTKAYYKQGATVPANFTSLDVFLDAELKKLTGTKYDTGYIKIFYLGCDGFCVDRNNNDLPLNGYSRGNLTTLFASKTDSTTAHEVLHSLGLPHTWMNKTIGTPAGVNLNAHYSYKYRETENIMDYSHQANIVRINLWKWQWEVARDNADAEP